MKKTNLKLKIPDSLSEITLDQYQRYTDLETEDNKGTYFLKQKAVEIFCHVPLSVVSNISHKQVEMIFNLITELLHKEDYGNFERIFTYRGAEFGMEPDFENMTSGVFIDTSTHLAEVKNWHKAMSALYRPLLLKKKHKILKIEQYVIEDYNGSDEYSAFMKLLPMDKVMGAVFFLVSSYQILQKDLMRYLQEEANKLPEDQRKKLSINDMDGTTVFTNLSSLIDTLGITYQKSKSMNFSSN